MRPYHGVQDLDKNMEEDPTTVFAERTSYVNTSRSFIDFIEGYSRNNPQLRAH
jgi:hypothetical protein